MKHLIYLLLFFSFSCANQDSKNKLPTTTPAPDSEASLEKYAADVLDILTRKDFLALAEQIEAGQKLLFSPYG